MNLEEELNISVNEKNMDEEKEVNDLNKLFNDLSPEQRALVMSFSKSNKEEQKEVPKEKVNDYKDNYVFPKEEEQETNMYPFGSNISLDNKYNQAPTELSQLIDSAFDNIGDELELDTSYRGTIKDIKLVYADNNGKYDSIVINYELNDNGLTKYTNDYYRFNWEYNHININKLVSFLKTIDGFYKDDFVAFTIEDIQKELRFLIGANISLKQNLNNSGYRENKVTVFGTFDRDNRRMVDR